MPKIPKEWRVDSPFARYLTKRGVLPNDLGPFKSFGTRLARMPEKIAPNSPMLPLLAEFLKIPLSTLRRFAEAGPMSPAFEAKIQRQIADDTLRKPKKMEMATDSPETEPEPEEQQARRPGRGHGGPFVQFCQTKGLSLPDVSARTGIPIAFMWRISSRDYAPNHPILPILADVLSVSVEELIATIGPSKRKPFSEAYHRKAQAVVESWQTRAGKAAKKPGKALVRTNGKQLATRGYNRLGSKRTQLTLRESARAMVATLNVSIMRGDAAVPPLPVGDLYLVLQDYLVEKGVKQNVLVDPDFATLFDPK